MVLLGLAYMMYRRRRSESAGDVVAVGWLRPVFRYGVAALSALLGGQLRRFELRYGVRAHRWTLWQFLDRDVPAGR